MPAKKIIALGCGTCLLLFLAAVAVVVLFVFHVAQDPTGMQIAIEAPATVARGQEFQLAVMVINDRTDETLEVGSIDIADEYLAGFTVVSTEPSFTTSTQVPVDESRSYEFKQRIPPGATNQFMFKLRARKAGVFSGEVDVCEGMRFMTMVVETVVE